MNTGQRGLHHIAYWVADLDAAMAHARAVLGVGPFTVLEHVDLGDFRFHGEPAVLDHSAAFAAWGPVLLELNLAHRVEPEPLREALGVVPGAVSHIAWTTDDLAAENLRLTSAGCGLLTTSVGGAVANWFSGGPLFGHPIEVHQPPPGVLAFWDSLRAPSD
jgi:catechol 2,3-dioxygenase-like lactoylglutathione lyase family enzyme